MCELQAVTWVIHHRAGGGGISPVVQYAARAVATLRDWRITVVSIHDSIYDEIDTGSGVRYVGLDLQNQGYQAFLEFLAQSPPDVVITNHVGEIDHFFPFLPRGLVHIANLHHGGRRYTRECVSLAGYLDGIFCVARHIEMRIKGPLERRGFQGLTRTVHNGAVFPQLKRHPRMDTCRLVFIGGVEPLKGVFDVVPLLRKLRRLSIPTRLTIVGGCNDALEQLLRKHGLDGSVTWAGWVPHETCYDYAAEADVFLMLSRKEPFGMVTIEAMAMGAVPIAYDTESGNREIIEHGRNGILVPLGSTRAMAEAIADLYRDREKLERLSHGAIDRARSRFGSERLGREMAEAIEAVVAHAEQAPSIRLFGTPPEKREVNQPLVRAYQTLSDSLRARVRAWIGRRPRLCYFFLDRLY